MPLNHSDWYSTGTQANRKVMVFVNSRVHQFILFMLELHATAASAVRNLNNTEVGGRPLRIDLADSYPFHEARQQ